jgi:two-component system response regulator YesN
LNRRFKTATGLTFNEYLNRYRIRKALEFMEQGVSNINDLAVKCGFGDYKYFGSVFRKYMDCSPKEYLSAAE